ncbi:PaaI family thioesterase [Paraburkholderia sediminicola]|uniref:PaaI family thioesterase n=1 Tax=Paraburkholderia sediminicola TaxID=458836 RepID=UPI0038BCC22A
MESVHRMREDSARQAQALPHAQDVSPRRIAGDAKGYPRDQLEAVIERTPFAIWLGAKLEAYGKGHVALSVPLRRELTMHHGFAHGAVIGFLADSACAWAATSLVGDVLTSEYKLNLLAPGAGDVLVGVGDVVNVSGRQVVCRADVFSVLGERTRLIATAIATLTRYK